MCAEIIDGLAGVSVQFINKVHHTNNDAMVAATAPVGEPAVRLGSAYAGIELPLQLPVSSVYSKDLLRRRNSVENSVHFERAGLQAAGFAGVVGPGNLQLIDVGFVDLGESRVVVAAKRSAIHRPVVVLSDQSSRRNN